MKNLAHTFIAITCFALSSGCLARQVATDGKGIRQALIDMYTDQAMDNLIRAHENRPFVQLKYSQLSVKDMDTLTANVNSGESDFISGRTFDSSKAAALKIVDNTGFNGKYPFAATGQRDRTMSFHADPITDQNYIYEAYLTFARNPGLFKSSEIKPNYPVHIMRKCGKKWYWLPKEAGDEFLNLVLATSLTPPAPVAEVYWDATIGSLTPRYNKDGNPVSSNQYVLTLSKEVANDFGLLQVIVSPGAKKVWLPIFPLSSQPFKPGVPAQEDSPGISLGGLTKTLYTVIGPDILTPDVISQLPGTPVLFLSQSFPNTKPKGGSDTQKTLDLLDNIRLQLTKPTAATP